MEKKVGEIFKFGEIKLQVVENEICDDCYFYNNFCCYLTTPDLLKIGSCCERQDKKSVIFKEIK